MFLVVAVVTPMIVISAVSALLLWRAARDSFERELLARAQAVAAGAERQIASGRSLLQALATSPYLVAGDLKSFYDQVARTPRPEGTRIGLSDVSGQMLISSRLPFGTVLPLRGDLDILRQVFETGQPKVSDLYLGRLTQEKLVAVDVPVMQDGHVIYDLRMGFLPTVFSRLIRQLNPPEGERLAGILDGRMSVIARIPETGIQVGQTAPPEAVQAISRGGSSGVFTSPGFDKHPLLVGYVRLPGTDWVAAAAIHQAAVQSRLWHSLLSIIAGGGVLLLLGLLAAMQQGRRIAQSIGGLSQVPAVTVPGGLREVETVAHSLAKAAADRERSEAALHERDARLRLAFETARLGAWEIDLATGHNQWDGPLADLLGFPPEQATEAAGKWLDVIHPDDRDRVLQAFQAASKGGPPYAEEFRVRRLDGVERIFMTNGARVPPGRMVGVVQDVTDLRAAEVSAHAALAELQAIYDSAPVGLCVLDTEMRWVRINSAMAGMNGFPVTAHIGRTLRELLPEIAGSIEAMARRVIEAGEALLGQEIVGQTPAQPGVTRVWQTNWTPLGGAAGRPTAVNVVVQEVTEKRATERALAEGEARFRAITDAMPQMVWSTRADGYHDYFNRRWYALTGTTPEQVMGDGWFPRVHPEDRDRVRARWRATIATGEPYEVECRLRMADGSYLWTLSRALPVRDPNTGAIVRWFGTCTDIEETVAAREALARSREDLERLVADRTRDLEATQAELAQARRLEALGRLAGGVAHDFNNLLQVVQGNIDLIDRRAGDVDEVRRHVSEIVGAADRGSAITRRLLTFSRRSDLRAEAVDAESLLTGMHDMLAHTLGDGIEIHIDVPDGLPSMLADKGQLETILVNLATNGRDAMAGAGTLTFAATAETLAQHDVTEHAQAYTLAAGSYVRLSVSDTGTGMDAPTLARASEPFFTTKPIGQGTGLGLAMARGFAEQSGGGFSIESSPGVGTTINLWFPVTMRVAHAKAPRAKAAMSDPGDAHAHLLVVDDDESVRDVIAEQMEAAGYEVRSVKSGADALAWLDTGKPVDVLVTDLSMPGMDGVALIHEAQRRRPGLPAILLTGFANAAMDAIGVDRAISGAFSWLYKPIDGQALAQQVAMLLEGGTDGA